ncbi:MAG: DegQ family serine endoprotease [Deltaproteobacteria bacterium]|nr:MAG: DegQ family serine endoprotease [Deltaproteobacteria bacterium]
MYRRLPLLLALLATVLTAIPAFAAPVPDFTALVDQLKPAVVNISTAKTVKPRSPLYRGPQRPGQDLFDEFFERFFRDIPQASRKERSLGTGFIISEDGYILTNDHVVDGADEIKVKLSDGRVFSGTIRGLDQKLDLALIKIEAGKQLPVARLGDSDKLRIGEWVMAIGNPFGLEQTVTVGIVSAKGRVIGAGPYDDFIQTDASINPGNSGGPLFNMRGEVIGINTAIVPGGQGIGFAIPVNMARQVVDQLRDNGKVTRGYLGVVVQPLTEELAQSFGLDRPHGALVSEVVKNSPAERAGLRRGDVILSFDGQSIDERNDLPKVVAAARVGKTARVAVFRDGRELELKVEVGRLSEEGDEVAEPAGKGETLGLTVAALTPELARRYDFDPDSRGVLVTAVAPDSSAAGANLRPGDLVVEVDGREVDSVKSFEAAVGRATKGKVLRLLIQRRDTLFYTVLRAG